MWLFYSTRSAERPAVMARELGISVCEFVAFEQQRLTFGLCKRIAKQSPKFSFAGWALPLPKSR
jgi:hypothetical protein